MKLQMKTIKVSELNDVIGNDVIVKTKQGEIIAGLANMYIDDFLIVSTVCNQYPGIDIETDDIESVHVVADAFSVLLKGHYAQVIHNELEIGLIVEATNDTIKMITNEGKYKNLKYADVESIYIDDSDFDFDVEFDKNARVAVSYVNEYNQLEVLDNIKLDEKFNLLDSSSDNNLIAENNVITIDDNAIIACIELK